MQVGQFFSLQNGRVGQYLSPRVLVVRTPFQQPKLGAAGEFCYFGFDKLSQAQKFSRYLARLGYRFQVRPGRRLSHCSYEVKLWGHADLTKTLAVWDRLDQKQVVAVGKANSATARSSQYPKPPAAA